MFSDDKSVLIFSWRTVYNIDSSRASEDRKINFQWQELTAAENPEVPWKIKSLM